MSINTIPFFHASPIIQFHLLVAFIAIAGGALQFVLKKGDNLPQDNWPVLGCGHGPGCGIWAVYP